MQRWSDGVAIVGMSCRFPGARTVDEFWQNLRAGVESIHFFDDEELSRRGVDARVLANPRYVRAEPRLEGIENFDTALFAVSPREAEARDPQHRVFLECAWEALEHAGYPPQACEVPVGVFAGTSPSAYARWNLYPSGRLVENVGELGVRIGNDPGYVSTWTSYKLNLKGPSVSLGTACSTSLVAVHLACRSLLTAECDLALAGGTNVVLREMPGYIYQEGSIFSPDGHCRSFDAKAAGTIFGSGAGVVVLKRLADAVRDGDCIWAVVRGSAVNNDGSLKVSYSAPSFDGQVRVIEDALSVAGVDAADIGYVEAHGTGTALGDPIEVAALSEVFRKTTDRRGFCGIGSVKSNIGHLSVAAGVAGLIKAVLALKHGEIPATLHFQEANPEIDFPGSPFYVNASLRDWPRGAAPRRAGVSSFGIGGTNAHVVLEEGPPRARRATPGRRHLLVWSAKTAGALETSTANLTQHLRAHAEEDLAEVAYSLQAGRAALPERRALVCESREDALAVLQGADPRRLLRGSAGSDRPRVVFVFPGQGAQHEAMGAGLYADEPVFRAAIDECAGLLAPELAVDLRAALGYRAGGGSPDLDQTSLAQPALFALEYALAKLWSHWGVVPDGMIGHSVGEYVAACLAGVMTLPDGLRLIARRGRLMQGQPAGAMVAVELAERELRPLLDDTVDVAAVNGPNATVVSGPFDAVQAFEARLAAAGVATRRLRTSHAFHSRMMDAILAPFAAEARRVALGEPTIPFVSCVTGDWIAPGRATDPEYWAQQLRSAVRFSDGVQSAGPAIFLEVGPGGTLSSWIRKQKDAGATAVPSMRHAAATAGDSAVLLAAAARLWLGGVRLEWPSLHAGERPGRVPLPTYPFAQDRCWIDARKAADRPPAAAAPRSRSALEDWFYVPGWKQAPRPPAGEREATRTWLALADPAGPGAAVVKRLARQGHNVVTVLLGSEFSQVDESTYTVDRDDKGSFDSLIEVLRVLDIVPAGILHLWTLGDEGAGDGGDERAGTALYRGFYSLLFLLQAAARGTLISKGLELVVVSSGVFDVTGDEPLEPARAAVVGVCRVAPKELAGLHVRHIDVGLSSRNWLDDVVREVNAAGVDRVVAFRGGKRWLPAIDRVKLETAGTPDVLRDRGVYVITGGLGGFGLTFARHLAQTVKARLALVGRTALPARETWAEWVSAHGAADETSRRIAEVESLERSGAEVLLVAADVADAARLQEALGAVHERFGRVHGVIHAAGVAGGGMIEVKDPQQAARVLAPKVTGTPSLLAALDGTDLDFVVLCSSIASVTGMFGQVDYCAANAFLDALAHRWARTHERTHVVSINWDAWHEVGMAVTTRRPALFDRAGTDPVTRPFGHPLLHRVAEGPDRAETVFSAELSSRDHWVLAEHRLGELPLLPGTAYLEMALAALEHVVDAPVLQLRDVVFPAPFTVPDGQARRVSVQLKAGDGGEYEFRIVSDGGGHAPGELEHARGRARAAADTRRPVYEVSALMSGCTRGEVGPEGVRRDDRRIETGPRWKSVKKVYVGALEELARVELDAAYHDDCGRFLLHPAVLDAATAFAQTQRAAAYLPLSYGRVTVFAPLPPAVWSYLRYRDADAVTGDLVICDVVIFGDDGAGLVTIDDFVMKRVGRAAAAERMEGASAPAAVTPAGARGMTPAEGVEVLTRILQSRMGPQVLVSTDDLDQTLSRAATLTRARIVQDLAAGPGAAARRPRSLASDVAAPGTDLERGLCELWSEVLGIEQLGVHDDFFDLGGNSLVAVQLTTRMREALGIEVPLHVIFDKRTVAEVSVALQGLGAAP